MLHNLCVNSVCLFSGALYIAWGFYKRVVPLEETNHGILKGERSLYCWPPVWLVWNQLYDYWWFLFLFAKQTNPNQSNRRSMAQWYTPFSIPCTNAQAYSCQSMNTEEKGFIKLTTGPITFHGLAKNFFCLEKTRTGKPSWRVESVLSQPISFNETAAGFYIFINYISCRRKGVAI